ncbi:MAG: isopeptide-forming domain-containing fimbrial protein [Lactobacillus sp.]|nr:isopeptide-forming domain-containing fimbrial protein [Lactobacillus sp.]
MKFNSKKLRNLAVVGLLGTSMSMGVLNTLVTTTHVVHADADKGDAPISTMPKYINNKGYTIPGKYGTSIRVTDETKIIPFSGNNGDWAKATSHTDHIPGSNKDATYHWYAFDVSDNKSKKGTIGVKYTNVGSYNGHKLDLKITALDWDIDSYYYADIDDDGDKEKQELQRPFIAFSGTNDLNNFAIFTPGTGRVKYRIDYLDHDTGDPIKITGQNTFNDIDGNQWVGLDSSTFNGLDQISVGDVKTGDSWLSYKKIAGVNYIYSDANQHNTDIGGNGTLTSDDGRGSFTTMFSDKSSLTFDWAYGITTGKHAPEDQTEVEKKLKKIMVGNYDPDADKNTIDTKSLNSISPMVFNHAFLTFSGPLPNDMTPQAPKKYVSDSDEGTNVPTEIGEKSVTSDTLKDRNETFHYQITDDVPLLDGKFFWDSYEITDQLDKILDADNVHVYDNSGKDVTYKFHTSISSGNRLKISADLEYLNTLDFYNQTYRVTFDARIKDGASLEDYRDPKHADQYVIPNDKATVSTNTGSADSNGTKTYVKATNTSIHKTVSYDGNGNDEKLTGIPFGKEFTYRVDVSTSDNDKVDHLEISDQLEKVLNLGEVHVYDSNGNDVTDQGNLDRNEDSKSVHWTAKDPNHWAGKSLSMKIKANIMNTPDLAKYLTNGISEIPNTANFNLNGKDHPSNKVIVSPETVKSDITKFIEVIPNGTENCDP